MQEAEARRGGRGCSGHETPSGSPRTQGRSVPPVFSPVSTGLTRASCLPFHQESLTSQVGRESSPRYKTGLSYPNYLHKLRQTEGHSDTYLTYSYRECCRFNSSTSRGSRESGPLSRHVKTSFLQWPNRGSNQVPSTDE